MANTNYGLSRPSVEQAVVAFGSARSALEKTGGDIPTLCFFIHNPGLVASCNSITEARGELYSELRDAAELAEVAEAWDSQEGDKKSVAEVMRRVGMGFPKAKRLLIEAGKLKA